MKILCGCLGIDADGHVVQDPQRGGRLHHFRHDLPRAYEKGMNMNVFIQQSHFIFIHMDKRVRR